MFSRFLNTSQVVGYMKHVVFNETGTSQNPLSFFLVRTFAAELKVLHCCCSVAVLFTGHPAVSAADLHNTSVEDYITVMQAMQTIDGSEAEEVFAPTLREIRQAGIRPSELIASCSFDGRRCSPR